MPPWRPLLSFFSDYFQIHVLDEGYEGDFSDVWTEQTVLDGLGITEDSLAIGTAVNDTVAVGVHVLADQPDDDSNDFDQVVEASLHISSGRLIAQACARPGQGRRGSDGSRPRRGPTGRRTPVPPYRTQMSPVLSDIVEFFCRARLPDAGQLLHRPEWVEWRGGRYAGRVDRGGMRWWRRRCRISSPRCCALQGDVVHPSGECTTSSVSIEWTAPNALSGWLLASDFHLRSVRIMGGNAKVPSELGR